MSQPSKVSVVVPFFNEEGSVAAVGRELREALEDARIEAEVILVDDGSRDETSRILDELARSWPGCEIVHLPENQGQSAALLAGFARIHAPVVVTMDGDGQSDPADIPKLLALLGSADMAVGIRSLRRDSWARRRISRVANKVRARYLADGVSDSGCALKAFRREVLSAFIPIRTLYSFMPALAVAAGFRVVEVPVNHRPRRHGASRYSVASFLFLPIVDFFGLSWFRSRRCSPGSSSRLAGGTATAFGRKMPWKWAVVLCSACIAAVGLHILQSRPDFSNPSSRQINLVAAENIALRQVPHGWLWTEELRMNQTHLAWMIDVKSKATPNIKEVIIDAHTGHILSTHMETPEEDAMEEETEEHEEIATKLLKPPSVTKARLPGG